MKSIGRIGVFIFLQLFIFPGIALLIQQLLGFTPMRLTWYGIIIALMGPYFFTYSKWANDNIWSTKTSKPNNTSYTSSEEVVETVDESIDNNQNILGKINLPSLSTKEEDKQETLLKIEELKRQIESLQASLKTNDSSTEFNSERPKKFNPDDFEHKADIDNETIVLILIVFGLLAILGVIII